MDRDRFLHVAELFEVARGMAQSEREPYVCERAGDDAELRDEVLALLRHYHEEGTTDSLDNVATPGFTLSALRHSPTTDGDEKSADRIGSMPERIDRYRIISKIAEGGMGVVYLAEQDQPRREVALKLIKPGMDSAAVIARFEQERQALAVIDHPNVAKVLDAGTTERSLPYFVMEYVRGVPITDFCDHHRLSINDRLKLFIRVCDAVQHAHTKGVIHRDLKPSNILVEREDGEPIPKVIDFGVAKALNQRLTERTIFTERGQLIGTPEYMSPEQAEMSGLDVDTRTDVYSLGVVLHELLIGALPFDSVALRSSGFTEIQRMIREVDPAKPSTKLLEAQDEDQARIAQSRRTDFRMLLRCLHGDLDWIVIKCLEKDRERRYDTPNALVMDLRRHQNNEPVLAGPPSTMYRLRKFVRRNRMPVVAGASAAATLLAATVVSMSFALAEAEQHRIAQAATMRAEAETLEAQRQADIAHAVNAFLRHDLLSTVRPGRMGKDILMVEVLDAAAMRLDEAVAPGGRFADKPEIEADIRHAIGVTYRHLGKLDNAFIHLERQLVLLREVAGNDDPRTLNALNSLGVLCEWIGRYEEAEAYTLEALEGRRRVFGNDHEYTLSTINNMGVLLVSQGRWSEAEHYYIEALEGKLRTLGEDHIQTLISFNSLGHLYQLQGNLSQAEQYLRTAVEISRRIINEEHPDALNARNNLGLVLTERGNFDEAEHYINAVMDARSRILGDDHPHTLVSIQNISVLMQRQGRLDEAEQYGRTVLNGRRMILGNEHPDTIHTISNMGAVLRELSRLEEADRLGAEAVWRADAALPADYWRRGMYHMEHGRTLCERAQFDEAEERLLTAIDILMPAFGETHEHPTAAIRSLIDLYDAWHQAVPDAGHDETATQWRAKLPSEFDGALSIANEAARSTDDG